MVPTIPNTDKLAQAKGLRMSALSLLLSLAFASSAHADVWFLGVGNDGYYTDVTGIYNAYMRLPNRHETPIHSRLLSNRGGSTILSDIGWLAGSARPGDLAMFYYSGHGGTRSDYSGEELSGWARNSYDETIGYSTSWCTDDQLADAFRRVDSRVPVLAIFDSCYAGGIVGGGNDLNSLTNAFVMMSSREDQVSYGGTPYSRFTAALINGISSDLTADSDITLGEWFSYARSHTYGQTPVYFDAGNFGSFAVIPAPEPATVALLGLGGLGLIWRRAATAKP